MLVAGLPNIVTDALSILGIAVSVGGVLWETTGACIPTIVAAAIPVQLEIEIFKLEILSRIIEGYRFSNDYEGERQ